MNVRLRRLQADYRKIKDQFQDNPYIEITDAQGEPPERYRIEYHLRGLMLREDGEIVERADHTAEIALPKGYPRRQPQCKMLTDVFHPNIDPSAICIADHWAPSESLADLIVRIGHMITYQDYNTKSPLNGEAARWADENEDLFPIQNVDLIAAEPSLPETKTEPAGAVKVSAERCENCGARSAETELIRCVSDHLVCQDCVTECNNCGSTLCVLCERVSCAICSADGCTACLETCPQCGKHVCGDHLAVCEECGTSVCEMCLETCSECGRRLGARHVEECSMCREPLCEECGARCQICGEARVYHGSELQECEQCNGAVCEGHIDRSVISEKLICSRCGVVCEDCSGWIAGGEATECSACGATICEQGSTECAISHKTFCSEHITTCELCWKSVSLEFTFVCQTCGRRLCRLKSHGGKCAVCGQLFCHECLEKCEECGHSVCPEHAIRCPACGAFGCPECTRTCRFCSQGFHLDHLERCDFCEGPVCPECIGLCDTCGREVCPAHFHADKKLCALCYERRDRRIGIIASGVVIFVIVGVLVVLLILLSG